MRAADGWIELGNFVEANEELERIEPAFRSHPDVLEIRWKIYANASRWEACVDIGLAITKAAPNRVFGWVHHSFALYQLKRIGDAYKNLVLVAEKFHDNWAVSYNLACYCAQLGEIEESERWFKKAMCAEEKIVQKLAIVNPALMPLWDGMSTKVWGEYLKGKMETRS